MPRNMVHPRLKRILSESSSAVSSPPDTTSDPGKPEPESEDQDPEVESPSHSNQKGSDAEKEVSNGAGPESPGSKMDISDEDLSGAPKVEEEEEDKVPVADADASSDTQKPGEEAGNSGKNTPSSASLTLLPPVHDGTPPGGLTEPSHARDASPQPPPEPSKSTSRSPSVHSTKDFKDTSPAPPSTSVSANRSPAPQQRPSLKIKLKLGARSSRVASAEAEPVDEKPTRGRRGRPRGSGKGKAKAKGKESASRPLTFTIPPRPRTDPSVSSTRQSLSRSQSSQHSSVESEDAEDADAESENENDAHHDRDDQNALDGDAMDVDLNVPILHDRLVDDVESEGDGDIPDDEMDDDSEVLPGGRKARLTARQAVLASMVGADHVELEASTSSRKKQLTSEEIALRREETARKRKNMSEKKLEDEKTETINRLLKKQSSRSRAKRSTLLNSSVVPTPQSPHSGDEAESDAVQAIVPPPPEQKGVTLPGPSWRWVSNRSEIRLGVPSEVLDMEKMTRDWAKIDVAQQPKLKPPATCNVSGCGARRKYRLVHDFERGACGMEHLRVLTGAA